MNLQIYFWLFYCIFGLKEILETLNLGLEKVIRGETYVEFFCWKAKFFKNKFW